MNDSKYKDAMFTLSYSGVVTVIYHNDGDSSKDENYEEIDLKQRFTALSTTTTRPSLWDSCYFNQTRKCLYVSTSSTIFSLNLKNPEEFREYKIPADTIVSVTWTESNETLTVLTTSGEIKRIKTSFTPKNITVEKSKGMTRIPNNIKICLDKLKSISMSQIHLNGESANINKVIQNFNMAVYLLIQFSKSSSSSLSSSSNGSISCTTNQITPTISCYNTRNDTNAPPSTQFLQNGQISCVIIPVVPEDLNFGVNNNSTHYFKVVLEYKLPVQGTFNTNGTSSTSTSNSSGSSNNESTLAFARICEILNSFFCLNVKLESLYSKKSHFSSFTLPLSNMKQHANNSDSNHNSCKWVTMFEIDSGVILNEIIKLSSFLICSIRNNSSGDSSTTTTSSSSIHLNKEQGLCINFILKMAMTKMLMSKRIKFSALDFVTSTDNFKHYTPYHRNHHHQTRWNRSHLFKYFSPPTNYLPKLSRILERFNISIGNPVVDVVLPPNSQKESNSATSLNIKDLSRLLLLPFYSDISKQEHINIILDNQSNDKGVIENVNDTVSSSNESIVKLQTYLGDKFEITIKYNLESNTNGITTGNYSISIGSALLEENSLMHPLLIHSSFMHHIQPLLWFCSSQLIKNHDKTKVSSKTPIIKKEDVTKNLHHTAISIGKKVKQLQYHMINSIILFNIEHRSKSPKEENGIIPKFRHAPLTAILKFHSELVSTLDKLEKLSQHVRCIVDDQVLK
eukprot:TRINITY_DN2808_c0_g1_i1.p1 TRINITY_DN2808_c0_g1~~TRINITY_DN2808_c0_g1_i1.p1  ORF type:complete len:737 (+),score=106.16 TRINITY_DN2808_c0_g1_i1:444-2654(+)